MGRTWEVEESKSRRVKESKRRGLPQPLPKGKGFVAALMHRTWGPLLESKSQRVEESKSRRVKESKRQRVKETKSQRDKESKSRRVKETKRQRVKESKSRGLPQPLPKGKGFVAALMHRTWFFGGVKESKSQRVKESKRRRVKESKSQRDKETKDERRKDRLFETLMSMN